MRLVANTRNHTRNKMSASAEAGIDKDVRRELTVGHEGRHATAQDGETWA